MGIKSKNPGEGPEMREKAARLCRDYLRGVWKQITSKDIVLNRISGGLSNWLYHVKLPASLSPKGKEPSQVLLRLYGQIHGERALEGLITESVIFTLLSERQLGPKLHGVFPGGRIEEFIPARPLKTSELSDPSVSALIAEKMAQVHHMNIPISKEARWLWDTIDRWLKNVDANAFNMEDIEPKSLPFAEKVRGYNLKAEVQWLKKFVTRVQSPVLFCHNDMQEGNILLHCENAVEKQCTQESRLVLIDFEYCSYNYRGFDLANHFVEWMYDYTHKEHPFFSVCHKSYPSREQQLLFVKNYILASRREKKIPHENLSEEETSLLKEVQAFTLASHFFWGLWSSVNARMSSIPFGYWEYAVERFESYFYCKNLLNKKPASLELPVKRKLGDAEG